MYVPVAHSQCTRSTSIFMIMVWRWYTATIVGVIHHRSLLCLCLILLYSSYSLAFPSYICTFISTFIHTYVCTCKHKYVMCLCVLGKCVWWGWERERESSNVNVAHPCCCQTTQSCWATFHWLDSPLGFIGFSFCFFFYSLYIFLPVSRIYSTLLSHDERKYETFWASIGQHDTQNIYINLNCIKFQK